MLLHDSLGCVALWRDFPQRLSEATGRTVIAYDRLGFGASDPHPGDLPPGFIEDEAAGASSAVRERLRLDRFVLFGHSVGGAMAAGCAAAFGERCHALVTESAQAFVEDRTVQGVSNARQAFAGPAPLERLRKSHGDKAPWVLRAWVDTWLSEDFRGWRLDAALQRVACPVPAIHGGDDEYGSLSHAERIAAQVQGPAVLEILPACGHVPHREQEGAVLRAVRGFLDGPGGARGAGREAARP